MKFSGTQNRFLPRQTPSSVRNVDDDDEMGGAMTGRTGSRQRTGAALIVGALLLTGCWGGGDDDGDSPTDST